MNTYVALCAVGAEKILGNELKLLGYKLDGNAPGRVSFIGDEDALYRANYCLRTSDRVYLQMAKYKASDFDELFDGCYSINWQNYFKKNVRVVVDKVRCHKSSSIVYSIADRIGLFINFLPRFRRLGVLVVHHDIGIVGINTQNSTLGRFYQIVAVRNITKN